MNRYLAQISGLFLVVLIFFSGGGEIRGKLMLKELFEHDLAGHAIKQHTNTQA